MREGHPLMARGKDVHRWEALVLVVGMHDVGNQITKGNDAPSRLWRKRRNSALAELNAPISRFGGDVPLSWVQTVSSVI